MRVAVAHNTSKDIARTKVEQRLNDLMAQFGGQAQDVQHEWLGDTLKFKGKSRGLTVEGTVEVTDAAVVFDAKLPLIAWPFEGKIRDAVQKEADALFRTA